MNLHKRIGEANYKPCRARRENVHEKARLLSDEKAQLRCSKTNDGAFNGGSHVKTI